MASVPTSPASSPAGTSATTPGLSEQDRAAALQALTDAARFYRGQVERSWVPDYLNRRNLYSQLGPAGLGHAPGGWATTRNHLRRHGHTDAVLVAAGLVRRTQQGRLVDVFRDRLMVPLTTSQGVLVGFTGRAIPDAADDVPKYLNSPASDIFAKHDLLYGLAEGAEALRRGAMPVLVEGPLDRLALTVAARGLAVVGLAPCGTAFGPRQARALLNTIGARRPVAVALDPDPAGRDATRRAWEVLTGAGAQHLRHVALPDGRDPAELVRNGRAKVLRHAIATSTPLAHAVADTTITAAAISPEDWPRALTLARQLFQTDLPRVPTDQVASYVAHVAGRLHLDLETATAAAADAVSTTTSDPRPTLTTQGAAPSRGAGRA